MNWTKLLVSATLVAALALAGCEGDDGRDGAPGPAGPAGPPGPPGTGVDPGAPVGDPAGVLSGTITGVAIDTAASAFVTVTFEVTDAAGAPVSGLTQFEAGISKLVTPAGDRPYWQSYINRETPFRPTTVLWAYVENGEAIEIEPGVYEYTMSTDLEAAKDQTFPNITSPAGTAVLESLDLEFDPTVPHRLVVGAYTPRGTTPTTFLNMVVDFVPDSLPDLIPGLTNWVVTNESCGSCHGSSENRSLLAFPNVHDGVRYDVNYCGQCHSGNMYDGEQSTDTEWVKLDMVTMIHKLHADTGDYFASSRDYGNVHYPQPVSNCLTCHDNNRMPKPEDRAAADALIFQERPSTEACGTCHEVDFTREGLFHLFADAPASLCLGCHGPDSVVLPVADLHNDFYSTPNNPVVAEDFYVFEFEIAAVVLNEVLEPQVRFRLLADGAAIDLDNLPDGLTGLGNLAFRLAYSMPQGDSVSGPAVPMPIDFNNRGGESRQYYDLDVPLVDGESFDQPVSRSLSDAVTAPGFAGPDAEGYYTTAFGIGPTPAAFPEGSVLRAIGFEGYFNTPGPDSVDAGNISGETILVGIGEGVDHPRRKIASIDNCNACHERLGFHSNSSRRGSVDYCTTCHNPEVSSSNVFAGVIPDVWDKFDTPVSAQLSMNLKDLVHATHAGKPVGGDPIREVPFAFIRGTVAGGRGQGAYDFSDIGYPAALADCETCHLPDTYKLPIESGALWSVVDAVPALAGTAADYAPEVAERQGPTAASCYGCHNTSVAKAHFELNTTPTGEACATCHGAGRLVPGHDE